MTPQEISIIKNEIDSRWPGVDASSIYQELCQPGTANVETWITVPLEDGRMKLHKTLILVSLTVEERAAVRALLSSTEDSAQDFKMLWESTDEFDINDPVFISTIDVLGSVLNINVDRILAIKRHGERLKSRSEELIGRNITIKEIQEVQGWQI